MFRDAYRVSIKITQGRDARVIVCDDLPGNYETWVLADSRDPSLAA